MIADDPIRRDVIVSLCAPMLSDTAPYVIVFDDGRDIQVCELPAVRKVWMH